MPRFNVSRILLWLPICSATLIPIAYGTSIVTPLDVTDAQATDFFKDLDDQMLPGKGPDINSIYLPGVNAPTAAQIDMAQMKYITDLNQVMAASAAYRDVEFDEAHGRPVPQAKMNAYNAAVKKATDSGALDRISTIQFNIAKRHFPDGKGGVNFADLQDAVTKFANGIIRTGAPGTREMNSLSDWYNWKGVAAVAIAAGVQKSSWQSLLPAIQTGLEIYRQVYPPTGVADTAPYSTSDSSRFDKTKQLTPNAIAALAKQIGGLTMAQIITREQGTLKTDTTTALLGPPSNGTMSLASLTQTLTSAGDQVTFTVRVTGPGGNDINGDDVQFLISQDGLVIPDDSFLLTGALTSIGAGEYDTSFLVPQVPGGYWYWADDLSATDSLSGAFVAVPEPAAMGLLGLGMTLLLFRRRR